VNNLKEKIRQLVQSLDVDDIGFATARDYQSPRSPVLSTIFPGVKSLIVLAFKELSNCESKNMQVAMGGRLDLTYFLRTLNYRLGRYLEKEFNAKAMTVAPANHLHLSYDTKGMVGDVSLRHAAVAAGLGNFGRHNLVIHPRLGSRVVFSAILTDLELPPDPPVLEKLCDNCNLCVENCPAGALQEEGKTDVKKCLNYSQPYGIGSQIAFWNKFAGGTVEGQKKMLKDIHFWRLCQANIVGPQYFCFNCVASCPFTGKP
jgi:epoxyqueuosine reductase